MGDGANSTQHERDGGAGANRPLCILIAGDPVAPTRARVGGFDVLIRSATGAAWPGAWHELDARIAQTRLPGAGEIAGVVVTGSASSVAERASWMLRAERWLTELVAGDVPVLGVCFGHQLLGQALGGLVRENPRGREMGTVRLTPSEPDPLLDGIGDRVNMSHRDSVVELPSAARLLATTALEPRAALRFARRAWGVQFHPEFDREVMREYITERRDALSREGFDPDRLLAQAENCPGSARVLQRFAALCSGA